MYLTNNRGIWFSVVLINRRDDRYSCQLARIGWVCVDHGYMLGMKRPKNPLWMRIHMIGVLGLFDLSIAGDLAVWVFDWLIFDRFVVDELFVFVVRIVCVVVGFFVFRFWFNASEQVKANRGGFDAIGL